MSNDKDDRAYYARAISELMGDEANAPSSIIEDMEARIGIDVEDLEDGPIKDRIRISAAIDRCSDETLKKRYTV